MNHAEAVAVTAAWELSIGLLAWSLGAAAAIWCACRAFLCARWVYGVVRDELEAERKERHESGAGHE